MRWGPVAIAILTLLGLHGWHLVFMWGGEAPLSGRVPLSTALLATLRDVPGTVLMLLPAWLPALVPANLPRLARWVTVTCGAIALAVGISFAFVFLFERETMPFVVAAVCGSAGALLLLQANQPTKVIPGGAHATSSIELHAPCKPAHAAHVKR